MGRFEVLDDDIDKARCRRDGGNQFATSLKPPGRGPNRHNAEPSGCRVRQIRIFFGDGVWSLLHLRRLLMIFKCAAEIELNKLNKN